MFINQAGNLYLVFELLDRDLKHHMDLTRGVGQDVGQAKVSDAPALRALVPGGC